jgi:hypothetical protein
MICDQCGSNDIKSLGVRFLGKEKVLKYSCRNCGVEITSEYKELKTIKTGNFVVTSAVDGAVTNKKFLAALHNYCKLNNAKLVILPVNNGKPFKEARFDDLVKPFLCSDNLSLGDITNVMGSIKLGSTLESPLHGINSFSKGKNVVFGHPQVQLKTLPRKAEKYPAIITTTGTISMPNYGENKTAQKANFNHSFSALFIDGKNYSRMRHLHYDGVGFYDLNDYYTSDTKTSGGAVEAVVTGDEHVLFYDEGVMEATYGKTGMITSLKPKFIVRHDVLDCYSISHHHKHNVFTRYAKYIGEIDSIEEELKLTLNFIKDTTPKYSTSIIVPSNHNSHLVKWLNEADPKQDMVNAKIYHQLMYLMLCKVTLEKNVPKYPDPFTEWSNLQDIGSNVRFLKPTDSFVIKGVDLNNHGDLGINGSRGSANQYKDLPLKTVVGHSHSPCVEKGSLAVGCSSNLRLDYNLGLSSWSHAHCIIHSNGKRQLIFIMDGQWK